MPIRGKVYIVPSPADRTWKMVVANEGDRPIGVTNNVLPERGDRKADDQDFGHGLPVNAGGVSLQSFNENHLYGGDTPIKEGCRFRVGLRTLAAKEVRLPNFSDPPMVLDIREFDWYDGHHPDTADMSAHLRAMVNRQGNAKFEFKPNVTNGPALLKEIEAMIEKTRIHCDGTALVTAVPGKTGSVSHWEVRFKNAGDTAWIGTCVFTKAKKNDGRGLESMAMPKKGCEAMQRIEANAEYGVVAAVGEPLRLGVRGWGYTAEPIPLPAAGTVEISLKDFKREFDKVSEEYFDPALVLEKRAEKIDKVQFFENGRAINAELKPKTWRGDEARQRSTFDAPHVVVTAVKDAPETPGGGWVVRITNTLPEKDEGGPVGFVATLRVGEAGWDPALVPPKKFEKPGEQKSWFIPQGAELDGVVAKAGEPLVVGTRGLGWFAAIPLPKAGEVDTAKQFELWGFREDQYQRANLDPDFTGRCRD